MLFFDRKEGTSTLGAYPDYARTDAESLRLRRLTEAEYEALPNKCKSRLGLIFPSGTGLGFVLASFFSGALLINAAGEIAEHKPDAGIHMLISAAVSLFFMCFSILAIFMKLNRYVSRDSLVTAGEVTQVTEIRSGGSKDYVVGYDCVIALHARKELVTIRDKYPVNSGSTVLIIKTRSLEYCLYEIPARAAAYDMEAQDFSDEITAGSELFAGDYSDYDKVSIFRADRRAVVGEEYREIPAKYRSCKPLSHGLLSVSWAVSVLLLPTLMLISSLAKKAGNDDMSVVMLGVFICMLLMVYFLSDMALKRQLPKGKTCRIECVPVRKVKNMGRCFVSVIIPDHRQYIDRVEIDPSLYDLVRVNEEEDMYFNMDMPVVKYVRGKYDKY